MYVGSEEVLIRFGSVWILDLGDGENVMIKSCGKDVKM